MAVCFLHFKKACIQSGWLNRCQVWAKTVDREKVQLDTDYPAERLDHGTKTLWSIGILV